MLNIDLIVLEGQSDLRHQREGIMYVTLLIPCVVESTISCRTASILFLSNIRHYSLSHLHCVEFLVTIF